MTDDDTKALVTREIEYDRVHRDAITSYVIYAGMLTASGLALLGVPAVGVAMVTFTAYAALSAVRSWRHQRAIRARRVDPRSGTDE